jgi:hypothetical protein
VVSQNSFIGLDELALGSFLNMSLGAGSQGANASLVDLGWVDFPDVVENPLL